ncbi:MAG: 30S ribosome-binding factor RbfA [Casimicrobiaceae bacterium]|nr:30S ribosome-binding factor RbfA [Casimicrobiaceae bacterium]MCX8098875.1 30S ribosome-binding factor RbfA [Casimicrobiaceae bacterium]MDW8312985.1 30S ribosome-binding factor RbfA [Burkholderiales bacterium]
MKRRSPSPRALRVAEEIQREIALRLASEVKDPRLSGITVTQVLVNADLSVATLRYVGPGGLAQEAEYQRGFASVAGLLRRAIAERLTLFKAPVLRFEYDREFEEGVRLSALIDQARADDRRLLGEAGETPRDKASE